MIENWIDETERRTWLLAAISGEAEVPGQIVVSGRSIVNHQAFCKKTDQRKELWYKYVWTTVAFHNIFDRAPGVHDRIVYFQP